MSDYISRDAMSETPKCPYCGAEMTGELNEFFSNLFEYRYRCECCGSVAPFVIVENGLDKGLKAAKAKALEFALNRVEPKNRVLTLEEVVQSEAMWYDDRLRTRARVVILGWGRCEPDFTKLVDRCGDEFYRKNAAYNDFWRCWLRKPTPKEMEGTPWES